MPKTLRLLLGDQLNAQHTWFRQVNPEVCYVLMETKTECTYVKHHIQKIIAFFLAMRAFAEALQQQGHQVIYLRLDDPNNLHNFEQNLDHIIATHSFERFEYLFPDEYRLDVSLRQYAQQLSLPYGAYDTEHFLTTRGQLAQMFRGKKTYLQERFYRQIRTEHQILMDTDGKTPLTGQWNYDVDNRNRYDGKVPIPPTPRLRESIAPIQEAIQQMEIPTLGSVDASQWIWYTTRQDALAALQYFVAHCLPYFGTYQDAMHADEPFLFHSRLSFALNVKLISPLEVVKAAIEAWQANPERIGFAQIEGFVRQIIGWREYMRGVYWAQMPDYEQLNFFGHQRELPQWYWNGQTQMRCLQQAIDQSLKWSYAHHIHRLMITGNFALLAGIHPDQVDAWYLGIYIDAIQWVEITNTRGMSQFADGGIVGSKPYASTANYIHKMSNYCKHCAYEKDKRVGEKACPFNSLYWAFYEQHRDKLARNSRNALVYKNLDKLSETEKAAVLAQAEHYLANLDRL
ncbi:MAG TPA: cryptochrome/photolyase family protein [Microscillaceae bacterium]|jgi:deoxyribodipyrimidine photolyase-related protein|nr:cryptochrome/photolyase family protein [Microscillaceae bacterium]